jgi:hypothetical protein
LQLAGSRSLERIKQGDTPMKALLFGLALAVAAPVASYAQVVVETPYWRGPSGEWRRWEDRGEHRAEERREEWRHGHCVRDFSNGEWCRY